MITFLKPPPHDPVTAAYTQCSDAVIMHVHGGGCSWDFVDCIVEKNGWHWVKYRNDGRSLAAMVMTLDKIADI